MYESMLYICVCLCDCVCVRLCVRLCVCVLVNVYASIDLCVYMYVLGRYVCMYEYM